MYRVLQYQIKAEPIPQGAPERATPDKWQAEIPDNPPRRARLSTALIPSLAFVPVIAAPPTPVYVSAQSCEPIAVQSFQYQAKAEPLITTAQAEDVTLDKWHRVTDNPQRRARRLVQYGVNFAIAEQADDGLPPVYWLPQTEIPRRQRLVRQSDGAFVVVVSAPDVNTLDKWVQQTQQPRQDLKRNQMLYPSLGIDTQFYLVPPSEIIRPDKWGRNYPDQIFRAKRLHEYGSFIIDPRQLTNPETSTLDRWLSVPIIQGRPNRPIFEYGAQVIQFAEALPELTWQHPVHVPRQMLQRLQHLYPAFTYVHIIIPPPLITTDPAVWQNLGSVTLNAADLATVTLLTENLGDPAAIVYEDIDAVAIVSESTGTVTIFYEDTEDVTIHYEDTDIA